MEVYGCSHEQGVLIAQGHSARVTDAIEHSRDLGEEEKRREEERGMVERHQWRPIGTPVTCFALILLLPADRRTCGSIGS